MKITIPMNISVRIESRVGLRTWLSLPANEAQFRDALNDICSISGDYAVIGYASTVPGLTADMLEDAPLPLINYLAARLDRLDGALLDKLAALMESDMCPQSVGELIGCIRDESCFLFLPGIVTDYDLGHYYLYESGLVQMPEAWKESINIIVFGITAADQESGAFTSRGYMKLKQNAIFFTILLLIVLACGALRLWADYPVTHISSDDGTRDLRGADFSTGSFDLYGPVEYIPNALLTPEEFEARQGEISIGNPGKAATYSTSRLRIYVPAGTYGLMLHSSGLASNVYINGRFVEDIGVPRSPAELSVPGVRILFYTVEAPNGVIEIVQQASTYVFRESDGYPESGGYSNSILGKTEIVREIYKGENTLAAILMGCFLALTLAHLTLYSMLRFYKANLWFALFCLTWFIFKGLAYPSIMSSFLPLPWYAGYLIYRLAHPATTLLFCLTLHELFPGVLQKWFRIALSAACGFYACVCLFADVIFASEALSYFYIVIFLTVAYILVRLCMKVRKPDIEQFTVLIGMGIFLFGALRDILFFEVVPMYLSTEPAVSELTQQNMLEYTLLIFVFFQMAAMFRGTMREIAAAKEAEQLSRLEAETQRRLNTMKSEFLGELSHELRMPISAISGIAQLFQDILDDEIFDRAEFRNSARWVESEAERMDRLVSQLLDMAAIEAGRFTLKKEDVSVAELFERISHIYFPMFNGAGNRLIARLDREINILADRERVLQILVNLVSNACKYTKDGEITLAAEPENGVVRFSVTDTGEGMTPEILNALFTRYPKMRGGVKGVTGNGLGLFISKKFAEAHGGEIGVESEIGKGTRVWFTIPMDGGYEE